MRKTAVIAVIASVTIAGVTSAGTPAATTLTIDRGLAPISATFPPLSTDEVRQRCRGFFRAITVRLELARMTGQENLHPFTFLTDLPMQRLEREADASGSDFITPYMVAFGPLNPVKTARSGLFNADRKTCTAFLDGLS